MKKVLIILLLLFTTFSCKSQIIVVPEWKVIKPPEGNFKFNLLSTPQLQTTPLEIAGEKTTGYSYFYSSNIEAFFVEFSIHPYNIDDLEMLKNRYDKSAKDMLSNSILKLLKSKDVYVGKHLGREVEFFNTQNRFHLRSRIYYIGNWGYRFTYAGKSENGIETFTEIQEREASKFLDSFELLNEVKPITASFEDSLPKNYEGNFEKGIYQNSAFGFSLKMPQKWIPVPNEQILNANSQNSSKKGLKILFGMTKKELGEFPNANLTLVIEKPFFRNRSSRDLAKDNLFEVKEKYQKSLTVTKDISEEIINGVTFYTCSTELKQEDMLLKQKYYFVLLKNYSLLFTFIYFDESELIELQNALKTFKSA